MSGQATPALSEAAALAGADHHQAVWHMGLAMADPAVASLVDGWGAVVALGSGGHHMAAAEPDDWYIEADPHLAWIWVCAVKSRKPRKRRCIKRRPPTEAEACAIQVRLREDSPFPKYWHMPGFCRRYAQPTDPDLAPREDQP